ncbi:MAG: acetyl-CoA carboxylase biotin carboxyl carrier protein subunit [Gemmatimonadetes bacterium]|nr:MAG: acetyl-CoA carboxylase biotin carboxyl carrier protein subunit [Gemmatimonadota bacterium]
MKKLRVTVNGTTYDVEVELLEDDELGGSSYGFPQTTGAPLPSPVSSNVGVPPAAAPASPPVPQPGGNKKELTSPIAGTVVEVKVSAGASVKENDPLVVIEAMKMNTNISSPVSGKIKNVNVKNGDSVQQGQVLITFE